MLLALLGPPLFLAGRALWRRIEETDVWAWLQQAFIAGVLMVLGTAAFGMFFVLQILQGAFLTVKQWRGRGTELVGVVQNFIPGDPGDHREESWDLAVAGQLHHYTYSPSRLTPGFRQTAPHGGLVRNGARVRVTDVDGYIARLEVAD